MEMNEVPSLIPEESKAHIPNYKTVKIFITLIWNLQLTKKFLGMRRLKRPNLVPKWITITFLRAKLYLLLYYFLKVSKKPSVEWPWAFHLKEGATPGTNDIPSAFAILTTICKNRMQT